MFGQKADGASNMATHMAMPWIPVHATPTCLPGGEAEVSWAVTPQADMHMHTHQKVPSRTLEKEFHF